MTKVRAMAKVITPRRPDSEDSSQNFQRVNTDPVTDLDASVPVTVQEDFLQKLRDNAGEHEFSRTFLWDGTWSIWRHGDTCFID